MNKNNYMKIKKSIIFQFALLLLIPAVSIAQSVSGKVIDKEKKPLEFASIAILNAKDSTLVSYTSTDKNGAYTVTDITNGNSIFQIHLIGYKVYQKNINFVGTSMNFGTIILEEQKNMLDEVVISSVIPITIKKDTLGFNTKAFKVRVDDSVEDLLKKLPGLEVDADGKVKAQGEDVSKVYVDGKEFFSGDPTVAIKNLSADAIKKVEVIDEKSDKARVTGVDDSDRSKVLNLVLKDDRKVNDFGKFQGGYGTDNRYLTSLSYNRFSPKIQASIIGKYNNVNSSGSDISEIMSFGGSRGSFRVSRGGSGGSGFRTTGIGGFNLGYELKKKQNLNADYFYNYASSRSGDVFSKRTEFIGTETLYSESNSSNESETKSNKANFSFIDRSNTLRTITMRGRLGSSTTNGSSTNSFESFNSSNVLEVENTGTSISEDESSNGSINLDYIKRFNEKSKRNMRIDLDLSFSKSSSFSSNKNTKTYTDPFRIDEVTVSGKTNDTKDNSIDFSVEYTEPLSDNHFLEVEAGVRYQNKDAFTDQTQSLNGANNSESTFKVDLFENKNTAFGSVDYKYNNEKLSVTLGTDFEKKTQDFGIRNQSVFNKEYTSINPSFRIRYRPKKGSWMFLRIRKSLNLPSLSQVSPVTNNFNPLYIRKGNQDLTPEKKYAIFGMYGVFDFVSGFSLFSHIRYDYSTNAIVNSESTDLRTRVRTSSYLNLGNKNSFSANINLGKRIKPLGIRYNLRLGSGFSKYQSVINGIENETSSKNGSIKMSLENNKKEKIDISTGVTFSKNWTSFSGTTKDRDYFQQTYFVKSDWNVTNTFNFSSQFKYDVYTDSNFGTDQSVPIWNASISYAFLKSKSLNLKLTALDLLNKSIGFSRTSSDNYYQETTKEVLGTYYMLSLTYTLNGNKGPKGSSRRGRRSFRRHH